ncbi:MAG: carboxypeptidase regulatory-like domain-containing protein [bacterium]|nr:carboxypeptidase regulatory-like domain-containing protein [bacterium]
MVTCCLFLLAALFGTDEAPAPIHLRLQRFVQTVPLDGSIRIVAKPIDRIEAGSEMVHVPVLEERTFPLALPHGGRWEITCKGEAVWCPKLTAHSAEDQPEIVLPMFPAVALSGRVVPPDRAELPAEITVQGWLYLKKAAQPFASFLSTIATEEKGNFHLIVPSGLLDLRIAAEGLVPTYLWSFQSESKTATIKPIHLRRGGSIAGFVRDSVEDLPANDALVMLVPAGPQGHESTRERIDRTSSRAKTNNRGFFQIAGIAPGEYRLEVRAPHRAPLRVEPLGIGPDSETHLKDDLILTALIEFEVIVEPPLDPDGRPWQVTLFPQLLGKEDRDEITKPANEYGVAIFSELSPQGYRIRIGTEAGETLLTQQEWVKLDADRTVALELPLIRIEGSVSLNGDPIDAKIKLETGRGDKRTLKTKSEEGEFEGWALRPERKVLFVTVTAADPAISRSFVIKEPSVTNKTLKLDLALKGVDVSGIVVDESGRPVRGAMLAAYLQSEIGARTDTDHKGEFTFFALDEGSYSIRAAHQLKGDSEPFQLSIHSGFTPPFLELVLRPRQELHGVVLSSDGHPVAGARVQVVTFSATPTESGGTTDIEGKFRIRVGSEARQAVFRVLAPSQSLWSGCRKFSGSEMVVLTLPPVPGGTLELHQSGDPDLPPSTSGHVVIINTDGGFLSMSSLLKWDWMMSGSSIFSGEDAQGPISIPNVAPGVYTVIWRDQPHWQIAASLCLLGPDPGLDWVELLPGGHAVLSYDPSEVQARE